MRALMVDVPPTVATRSSVCGGNAVTHLQKKRRFFSRMKSVVLTIYKQILAFPENMHKARSNMRNHWRAAGGFSQQSKGEDESISNDRCDLLWFARAPTSPKCAPSQSHSGVHQSCADGCPVLPPSRALNICSNDGGHVGHEGAASSFNKR